MSGRCDFFGFRLRQNGDLSFPFDVYSRKIRSVPERRKPEKIASAQLLLMMAVSGSGMSRIFGSFSISS